MTCRITVHHGQNLQKQWGPRLRLGGTLADFPTRVGNQPRRILHAAHSVNKHGWTTMKRTDFGIEPGSATIRSQCPLNSSCGSRRGSGQSEYLGLQRYGWRGQLVQQVQDRPAGRTKGRGHGRDWERRRRAQSCLPTETRRSPPRERAFRGASAGPHTQLSEEGQDTFHSQSIA